MHWAFREIGQLVEDNPESTVVTGELPGPIQALLDVSLLVTTLGDAFQKDVLERFSQLQLIPYERKFMTGKQFAGLEHLEHRWIWFRALMACIDKKFPEVFPASWRVQYVLYLEFIRRTKIHLKEQLKLLEEKGLTLDDHVKVLLCSLKEVLTFTEDIKKKVGIVDTPRENESQILFESINEAFDDFLDPYVKVERNSLDEMIQSMVMQEEQSAEANEVPGALPDMAIYDSSRKIFEVIKKSLRRCSTFSNGNTLVSLSMEFRICLQQYANSLTYRMPRPIDEKSYMKDNKIVDAQPGHPFTYEVTPDVTKTLCRIIRTGEYCAEVVPQLETQIKQLIRYLLVHEIQFPIKPIIYDLRSK